MIWILLEFLMIGFIELLPTSRGIKSLRDGLVGVNCSVKSMEIWATVAGGGGGPPGKCSYTWVDRKAGRDITEKISEIFLAGDDVTGREGSCVHCAVLFIMAFINPLWQLRLEETKCKWGMTNSQEGRWREMELPQGIIMFLTMRLINNVKL